MNKQLLRTLACKTNGLCQDFTKQSRKTWNTLRKAEHLGLSISEESITDFNLLELEQRHQHEIITRKFNRRRERQEGADWEWWLVSPGLFLGLRIQAKKIDSQTLNYPHLGYSTPNGHQIDILIKEAVRSSPPKIPMYVLYSYWDHTTFYAAWPCRSHRRDIRMFGCSIVEARALRSKIHQGKTGLADIDYLLHPWSCMICCNRPSPHKTALSLRSFNFISETFADKSDFPYRTEEYVAKEPPWYVTAILEERKLPESAGEEIGVDLVTIIREKNDL